MSNDNAAPTQQEQLAGSIIGTDISFLLARANAVSLGKASAHLRAHDLRIRSYSVLALACDETRPSQKEIAEFLRLDPSQVVSLIDDLQRRGFVERVPDPRDRRSNVLVATKAGQAAHAKARVDVLRAEDELLAGLDAADRDALGRILRRLAFSAD